MENEKTGETATSENGDQPDAKKPKLDIIREGSLLGYGNPLLDIQVCGTEEFLKKIKVNVTMCEASVSIAHTSTSKHSQEWLEMADDCLKQGDTKTECSFRYDLEANNAILAEDKHKPMYKDMTATFSEVQYIPGGATLNAIKIAQWLVGLKNATSFFGCVSNDEYGNILEEKAKEMGVNVKFQITEKEQTGTCGVIVTGENRSLCANLAAANLFTEEHLDDKDNWALVEKAQYFYCAGFPLTVSPPSMLRLAKHSHENNKTFCMNLSAPFLCQFFKKPMLELIPYVDILFGNETEAATFSKENDFGTEDVAQIALKASSMPKENKSRSRVVVFTQGESPVIVAQDGKIQKFDVIPIKSADIVDCNGAGDAFVGGFLAQLVQGKAIDECVRCGNYAANLVIQQSGCTVPDKPNFK